MKKQKIKQSEQILVNSSDSYYDDCPVCQAMKKAEEKGKNLNMVEIAEAFGKAKKQGAVVGDATILNKDDTIN